MPHMSPVIWIIIAAISAVVALLIGYLLGSRLDGGEDKSELEAAKREHEDYKSDVREHFQQTSAIMSRLAEDYRDMHQHMAAGAERLGEMDREKLATGASPERLTSDSAQSSSDKRTSAAHAAVDKATGKASGSASPSQNQSSKPASTADAKVNGGKPSEGQAKQPSDAAKTASAKSGSDQGGKKHG